MHRMWPTHCKIWRYSLLPVGLMDSSGTFLSSLYVFSLQWVVAPTPYSNIYGGGVCGALITVPPNPCSLQDFCFTSPSASISFANLDANPDYYLFSGKFRKFLVGGISNRFYILFTVNVLLVSLRV